MVMKASVVAPLANIWGMKFKGFTEAFAFNSQPFSDTVVNCMIWPVAFAQEGKRVYGTQNR